MPTTRTINLNVFQLVSLIIATISLVFGSFFLGFLYVTLLLSVFLYDLVVLILRKIRSKKDSKYSEESLDGTIYSRLENLSDNADNEIASLESKIDLLTEEGLDTSLDLERTLEIYEIIESLKILNKYDSDNTISVSGSDLTIPVTEKLNSIRGLKYYGVRAISNRLTDLETIDMSYETLITFYKAHLGVSLLLNKHYTNQLNDVFEIEEDTVAEFTSTIVSNLLQEIKECQLKQIEKENQIQEKALFKVLEIIEK